MSAPEILSRVPDGDDYEILTIRMRVPPTPDSSAAPVSGLRADVLFGPMITDRVAKTPDEAMEPHRRRLLDKAAARYLDYTRHGEDLDFMNDPERAEVERMLHLNQ